MIATALLQSIAQRLRGHGIPDSAKEAELMLTVVSGLSRPQLYASVCAIPPETISTIQTYAARRIKGEPLHYILGHLEFMGLKISVGPGVLIPRPETELLVEEAIRRLRNLNSPTGGASEAEFRTQESEASSLQSSIRFSILDLCSGSGCIALSLALAFPAAHVWGVDISPDALVYARKNAAANSIGNVTFVEGNLFAPLAGRKFRCITANPPYIKTADIAHLQVEIREHEPFNALNGGTDGFDFYRRILAEAPAFLERGGLLIMELGQDQAEAAARIAHEQGFDTVQFREDYAGIRRFFAGQVSAH